MSQDMFFVGQIVLLPYDFAPDGFLECNGQPLDIMEHQTVFSLIGRKFGGDLKTFFLPDYSKIAPEGSIYCICIYGLYPSRS